MNSSRVALAELRNGPLYRFADWPNSAVPNGRIGAYTVWRDNQLIYVGMAGRALGRGADSSGPASAKPAGLRSRLASHASGRRSGDQFCVYVFDRLVLPTLSRQQVQDAARGQLSLDGLTRQLIRQSLGYRFTLLSDAATARAVERQIQREGLHSELPLLNPLPRTSGATTACYTSSPVTGTRKSVSSRFDLPRLHTSQSAWRLLMSLDPPRDRGTM